MWLTNQHSNINLVTVWFIISVGAARICITYAFYHIIYNGLTFWIFSVESSTCHLPYQKVCIERQYISLFRLFILIETEFEINIVLLLNIECIN